MAINFASENSCSKNFTHFQEKHPMKLLFSTKLQVTININTYSYKYI